MSDRYHAMFERQRAAGEGAFVPFTVLGDPDPLLSLQIVRALVDGGADALELGIAFSDPVADGPTIQAADVRALEAGVRPEHAWSIISAVRAENPALPIGLLVYANLVEARGADAFYARASAAGVDSVLIADVPTLEIEPYLPCAARHEILPVMIATSTADEEQLAQIARASRGYTYVVTRAGVTGADDDAQVDQRALLRRLAAHAAPPPLLGFGISQPEHVRAALRAGAAGAISGSAVVRLVAAHRDEPDVMLAALREFVGAMKRATRS